MKILLLTRNLPYPLSAGGKIAQYSIIDSLRKLCTLVLVVNIYSEYDREQVDILKQRWPDVEFREIQFLQQAGKISFKEKLKNIVRKSFKKAGTALISTNKKNGDSIYDTDNAYLIHIFEIKQRRLIDEIAAIIADAEPDIVQIEIIDYVDLVTLIPGNIKRVFVHQELRFARLESFFEARNLRPAPYDEYIIKKIKIEELAFLKQYDGIFTVSEEDKEKLIKEGLENNIYAAPFSVLDEYFIPVTKENSVIDKLVFVGAENHSPNLDAIEWYINEIAAEINKVRKTVLHVIGNWSEKTIAKYREDPNIHFAGYVEDLVGYCKRSAMLVPVRIGSGIRAKILVAMAQGLPVISTGLGCEGIKVKDNESIMIADTAAAFGTAYKTLLEDSNFTFSLVQSAQSVANKYYSQRAAAELRMKYFEEILRR